MVREVEERPGRHRLKGRENFMKEGEMKRIHSSEMLWKKITGKSRPHELEGGRQKAKL
jgi:hypothetical protein